MNGRRNLASATIIWWTASMKWTFLSLKREILPVMKWQLLMAKRCIMPSRKPIKMPFG